MMNSVIKWENILCPIVIPEVYRAVVAESLLVVTTWMSLINPYTSSVITHTRDIFWNVKPCCLVEVYWRSEELTAFVFKVEEQSEQAIINQYAECEKSE
jgi:hypothetical protein